VPLEPTIAGSMDDETRAIAEVPIPGFKLETMRPGYVPLLQILSSY
jgi:hypothetical protein